MSGYKEDLRELDATANEFTLKCLRLTMLAFMFVWILNMIGVFIVDRKLMTVVFAVSSAVMLLPTLICKCVGTRRPWVKYMILFSSVLAITLVGCALSFHSVLLFALPLIYAAQYSRRRMIFYAYALTAVGIFVGVMSSYYFGITDANMLLLTNNTTDYYVDLQNGILKDMRINMSPWATLPRYFILPRCIILLVFIPVIINISGNIANTAVRTAHLKEESEIDKMTQFYNNGKYKQMIEGYYPEIESVAVIFWDIDNLKYINDTYGHLYGDFLISSVADIIRTNVDETHKAYRVGGDEFVMILENPERGEAEENVRLCKKMIAARNDSSNFPVSASAGMAEGSGADIAAVIHKADSVMYQNKKASKKGRTS